MLRTQQFLLMSVMVAATLSIGSAYAGESLIEEAVARLATRLLGEDAKALAFEAIAPENGNDVF